MIAFLIDYLGLAHATQWNLSPMPVHIHTSPSAKPNCNQLLAHHATLLTISPMHDHMAAQAAGMQCHGPADLQRGQLAIHLPLGRDEG
jgi:hypothetical protein